MDSSLSNLVLATAPVVVPTWVRVILWSAIAVAFLMALGIGIALLAGNNSGTAQLWRYFLTGFGLTLLVQGGYLLAPFAIGRSWWLWAFIWMLPVVLLAIMSMSVPVLGAIKWTRPDGASGWKTIASIGWFAAIGFALYITPPVLMWIYRPASTATAP